jgi:hypothetical protein
MMQKSTTILTVSLLLLAVLATGCKDPADPGKEVEQYEGLVINEIAAHDEITDGITWVEILNTTDKAISLEGIGLYITDAYFKNRSIWSGSGSLAAGARLIVTTEDESLVTGIASDAQFVLKLGTQDAAVDEFDRAATFAEPKACYKRGSYQRIPDGSATWKNMTYHSRGGENVVFKLEDYKHTAIWTWSAHVADLMENDAAQLKEFKRLGYDHILLNYVAFGEYNLKRTLPFLDKCDELGIAVHCWMQCFYNGGWINPIDDANNRYKEEIFADIREHAEMYLADFGVKGLHLDYIRFGGTASQHNPSTTVNAIGAVNRCCREIREIADSFDCGIVTSAALMPEKNSTAYYGQDPAKMGQYIHILMPMCYRYSYGWGDSGCKNIVNWFCDNSGGAQVWAGITTYTGNDSGGVKGMTATELRKDIDVFMDSKANGLVLFRCGLGQFPDVNDLK